jgi:hypothetical protein
MLQVAGLESSSQSIILCPTDTFSAVYPAQFLCSRYHQFPHEKYLTYFQRNFNLKLL